eukprot:2140936-Rhodomonas_salina.1
MELTTGNEFLVGTVPSLAANSLYQGTATLPRVPGYPGTIVDLPGYPGTPGNEPQSPSHGSSNGQSSTTMVCIPVPGTADTLGTRVPGTPGTLLVAAMEFLPGYPGTRVPGFCDRIPVTDPGNRVTGVDLPGYRVKLSG